MKRNSWGYHLLAFVIVAIWGSTFVFTKLLLQASLSPAHIFTLRFSIAYLLLLIDQFFDADRFFAKNWKDELLMVALGLTGGSLYFLAENAAMLYTTATNTSLIVCSCPLFAMLLMKLVYRQSEPITRLQALGSVVAFLGMVVVVLNGHFVLHLSPLGDMLAFVAWNGIIRYFVADKPDSTQKFGGFRYSVQHRIVVNNICKMPFVLQGIHRTVTKPPISKAFMLWQDSHLFAWVAYYEINPGVVKDCLY